MDNYEVTGEVIKMIYGELPAIRWSCGGCGEDNCTIFYEADSAEKEVACGFCGANNLVHNPQGS